MFPPIPGNFWVGRFLEFLRSNVRARNSWCLVTAAISWEQHTLPPLQRLEDGMVDDRTKKKEKRSIVVNGN